MVLPSELYIKIGSYLEPPDLKSYSLVSRQVRTCALECMVFDTHDKETITRAIDAGARKLKLTCDGVVDAVDGVIDAVEPNKVVEMKMSRVVAVDLQKFKNLTILNIESCGLTQLPTLPSALVTINCWGNQLTQLPTLPSTLETLYCSGNQLTQLPTKNPH